MAEVGSVALLAPIPLEHLSDGVEVCTREGKVAFGSQAWETLTKFEDLGGVGAPVLIYASHNPSHVGAVVTWVARYADYVESRGGAHPARDRYRPPSCHDEDRTGHWAGFYEVESLRQLDDPIPITTLRNPQGKPFKANFVPEGPTVIAVPRTVST